MASRKIQATLSDRSSARVDQIQEAHKKMGIETADSAAVNALIEILCNYEAEFPVEELSQ